MSHPAGTSPGGLRERKKRATREALRQAAIGLFRDHDPESVTVDDICARADVSPRTFFNYFAAKEEVLVPWDHDIFAYVADRIPAEPAAQEPLTVLHTVLSEAVDSAMAGPTWRDQTRVLREHPELLPRVINSSRTLEATVIDGLAQRLGRDRTDPYVNLTGGVAMTALRTAVQCHGQTNSERGVRDYLDELFAHLHAGLRPPSGS